MTSDVHSRGGQEAWHASPAHQHLVQFYESDDYLLLMLAQFVASTLRGGEAGMVVATDEHVDRLKSLLANDGIDVSHAMSSGQFVALEASEVMSRFMIDGSPDPVKFRDLFGSMVDRTLGEWPSVRIFGEMVALTAAQRSDVATVDLERLWNDLLETHDFSLCCAYPLRSFSSTDTTNLLLDICEQHSAVFPAESYSTLSSDDERFREIALLQQKAAQLEDEVVQRARAQERLQEALAAEQAARQEAENALRVRDEFVSIAAHELKSPLTSLVGRAQLAVKRFQNSPQDDPAQMTKLLQSVVGQADKLSRLITQLLDVSRLRGGKLAIERQPVDLVELLHESIRSVDTGVNGHALNVKAPETLIAEVDPLRLEQVIVNLLNNAVKYSPMESEIEIVLSWPEGGIVELAIQDQGPGIPPAERERIFERFYQVRQGETPTGLGLGLYICREIIELHGGDVLAEFPDAGGTRFIVRLPISPHPPVSQVI